MFSLSAIRFFCFKNLNRCCYHIKRMKPSRQFSETVHTMTVTGSMENVMAMEKCSSRTVLSMMANGSSEMRMAMVVFTFQMEICIRNVFNLGLKFI